MIFGWVNFSLVRDFEPYYCWIVYWSVVFKLATDINKTTTITTQKSKRCLCPCPLIFDTVAMTTQQTDFKWVSMLNVYALMCLFVIFLYLRNMFERRMCALKRKQTWLLLSFSHSFAFSQFSSMIMLLHTYYNMRFKHTNCIYSIRPICVILKRYNNNILNVYTLRELHKSYKSIYDFQHCDASHSGCWFIKLNHLHSMHVFIL